jgi:drug/metabolite transporter (DMT)-like permease
MLAGSLAFAVMASLGHALGMRCDWQIVALARSSLALVFALVVARATGVRLVFLRPAALWMRSLAGSTSLVCSFYALTRMPAADLLTLGSTFAIWIALLSWPLEGSPPGPAVWLAILSGVAGVALIQQPQFNDGWPVIALALLSAFFTALAMLGLNRVRDVDPVAIVVHFSTVASLVCIAALFTAGEPLSVRVLEGATPWMLLGVGLSATAGQICLTKAFATGAPTKVSVVCLSQIVFALLLDVLVSGHTVGAEKLLGMALVAAPAAWLMSGKSAVTAAGAAESSGDVLAPGD